MRIDCHVHISANTPGRGKMSSRLQRSFPFRYMRWHFGLRGDDRETEQAIERILIRTVEETTELDGVVLLAFDAVHTGEGRIDEANTHFYVTNDYVAELTASHPKLLFGASIHPYRKDAPAEVERCVKAGAVLCKWLPIVQGFNPTDVRCLPLFDALAHFGLPLLSHTGGEQCLPNIDKTVASPVLLEPALKRGVKVIAAHCGTRAKPFEPTYITDFVRMAREYEHFYGDTSALNLPMRWHAFDHVLPEQVIRAKLVHGSDWPVIVLPSPTRVGWRKAYGFLRDHNWLRRDVAIKRSMGFDDDYFRRAAKVLLLPSGKAGSGTRDSHGDAPR